MSLCRRLECACGAVEDAAPENNLGVERCARFGREHRAHEWRALVLDDETQDWVWSTPALVRVVREGES
jgi:hypothetical protein